MEPIEPKDLQDIWPIPGPWTLQPMGQGDNNSTRAVETPGGSYVLRTYPADRPLERIRYELGVLSALQQEVLPFQVPAPVPTITGDLFAVISRKVCTLTPWLSGSTPRDENLDQASAAGQALGELIKTLANLQVDTAQEKIPFPPSNDFEGWGGTFIEPGEVLQGLPLTAEVREQTLALLNRALTAAPSLYRDLPQQIIHRDFDQSNVLMDANTVTGVLDFEFCGRDLRVLDLAYALSQWPGELWNTGSEWAVVDAFARGFLQRQELTRDELERLPDVLRLRAATSLFYRFGRLVRGIEPPEDLVGRIRETLFKESWLQAHEGKLLNRVHGWS